MWHALLRMMPFFPMLAGAGDILWVDKGCWLMIFSLKLNIYIHTSTMDYNWLGIGIRIGFLASNSMYYIREQLISSTSNKLNQLVANLCNARDSFKSNVNTFKFKHLSNFNYWKLNWLLYKMKHVILWSNIKNQINTNIMK